MLTERIRDTAECGFALDVSDISRSMTRIASDGRKCFRTSTGTSINDAIRAWQAHNRDVTFRAAENKTIAKLHAERHEHVSTYERTLRCVSKENPEIFDDGDHLWNMGETDVCAGDGNKVKVFGASDTHHDGYRAQRGGMSKTTLPLSSVCLRPAKSAPRYLMLPEKMSCRHGFAH